MDRPEIGPLPEVLLIDVDGVLTDGKLYIDHLGEKLFKAFNTRDVRAIRQFIAYGVEVYLLSADGWEGGPRFAEKVGAVFYELRDKAQIVEHLKGRRFWAIGDDAWDVGLLKAAERAFCPGDADYSVWHAMDVKDIYNLNKHGGHGVIAELLFVAIENNP